MKTLKALGAALALALSLSIPAFPDTNPGDVHLPGCSTPAPSVSSDPTSKPDNTGSTNVATEMDNGISFLTIADVVWALAAIY